MKIYRATKREDGQSHAGYFFTDLKSEAKRVQDQQNKLSDMDDEVKELNLSMNKWDVINFLNRYASHPNNG